MEQCGEGQRPRELGPDDAKAEHEADPCQDEAGQPHHCPHPGSSGESKAPEVLTVPDGTHEREQASRTQFGYVAHGHGGHGVLLDHSGVNAGFMPVIDRGPRMRLGAESEWPRTEGIPCSVRLLQAL
jgi:hypothetical protein